MSKTLLGSRESSFYLWRYHDDNFPYQATMELKHRDEDDKAHKKLIKIHWSRNHDNHFKFTFGRDRHGALSFTVELPWLFFFDISLPYFSRGRPNRTGIEYFYQTLWIKWWQRDDWTDEEPGGHWTWRWRRTFLGTFEKDEETLDEKTITRTIPGNNSFDDVTREFELRKYKSVQYRSYFPWWNDEKTYVEVWCPDGIPHPGKGTTSYNISDDALLGSTYKTDSFSKALKEFINDGLEYRDKYPK
jgi:hypothetical protein